MSATEVRDADIAFWTERAATDAIGAEDRMQAAARYRERARETGSHDDYLNAEHYVMLGNFERDPDRFQKMLEIGSRFLKSLNLSTNGEEEEREVEPRPCLAPLPKEQHAEPEEEQHVHDGVAAPLLQDRGVPRDRPGGVVRDRRCAREAGAGPDRVPGPAGRAARLTRRPRARAFREAARTPRREPAARRRSGAGRSWRPR